MTVTQTVVERLRPEVPVVPVNENKVTKRPLPSMLLRTASFDRLKQFPSSINDYFCRHGSDELIRWLSNSRTQIHATISQLIPQLRGLLLTASVYGAFCLVSLQLLMCLVSLVSGGLPNGLAFLLTCIAAIIFLAFRINLKSPKRRIGRSRTRKTKNE